MNTVPLKNDNIVNKPDMSAGLMELVLFLFATYKGLSAYRDEPIREIERKGSTLLRVKFFSGDEIVRGSESGGGVVWIKNGKFSIRKGD